MNTVNDDDRERQQVISELKKINRALVLAHERPDGDALGSALAMSRILRALGKKATLTGIDPLPRVYEFLFHPHEIVKPSADLLKNHDTLIALDCGDLRRIAAFADADLTTLRVFNIDHHQTNDRFGNVVWIGKQVSSTGEMLCQLLSLLEVKLTAEIAEPLWVAITSDTGSFNYANTTPATLRHAADLLAAGVDCHKVQREIRERQQLKDVLLMRRALERLEVLDDGRLGIITLTEADFAEFSTGPHSLQEGVSLALMIDGVQAAAFVYELPNENKIKVSMRAYAPYDVAKLAQSFGGGGHARAAGFSLQNIGIADARGRVIAALTKLMRTR